MPELILRADHLTRAVPGRVLVNDVSFEVRRGFSARGSGARNWTMLGIVWIPGLMAGMLLAGGYS